MYNTNERSPACILSCLPLACLVCRQAGGRQDMKASMKGFYPVACCYPKRDKPLYFNV